MHNETVINEILQKNVPVLYLDTCAFLDILRVPHRENLSISDLSCFKKVKVKIDSGEVVLVTNSLVKNEFNSHFENTFLDLENQSKKIENQFLRLEESQSLFLLDEIESRVITGRLRDTWLNNIKTFCRGFFDTAIVIQISDDERIKGSLRGEMNIPPSRQGGSGKDCTIFESLLHFSESLRNKGFNKPVCFVTSNTKDFGSVSDCKVSDDLSNSDIRFANQLHHAYELIYRVN